MFAKRIFCETMLGAQNLCSSPFGEEIGSFPAIIITKLSPIPLLLFIIIFFHIDNCLLVLTVISSKELLGATFVT